MFLLHILHSQISGFVFEFMPDSGSSGRDQERLNVDGMVGGNTGHWAQKHYLTRYLSKDQERLSVDEVGRNWSHKHWHESNYLQHEVTPLHHAPAPPPHLSSEHINGESVHEISRVECEHQSKFCILFS